MIFIFSSLIKIIIQKRQLELRNEGRCFFHEVFTKAEKLKKRAAHTFRYNGRNDLIG